METRSLVLLTYLILQIMLPKEMALKQIHNVDEFMIEDQRTHKRQNYLVQRALDEEMSANIETAEPAYIDSFEPKTGPEELPALIVDYANRIRNDIILLDNTVETRTRKRGNVRKYNQAIPFPRCTCNGTKPLSKLTGAYFPRVVPYFDCSEGTCDEPYRCKEIIYTIEVLKEMVNKREVSKLPFGSDYKKEWIVSREPISVGCVCTRD